MSIRTILTGMTVQGLVTKQLSHGSGLSVHHLRQAVPAQRLMDQKSGYPSLIRKELLSFGCRPRPQENHTTVS